MRFDAFMDVVLKHEGGYVNDPDDLGGETNYGITKRRYPEMDIKNLSIEQAKEIYRLDFFNSMNLHYISDDLLALHLFDMGINAGRGTAIKLLQELLKGVDPDGIMGPFTAQRISYADPIVDLTTAYMAKRIEYYYKVSLRRNNKKFLRGWINRVYSTKL